jgi:hypothetical protein
VGIVGFFFLGVLIFNVLAPAVWSRAGAAPAALGVGALIVNFGESILFALGGMGLLVWLMFGAARVMGEGEPL